VRIGVMLRAYDEHGGVGVYTQNIIEELLRIDRRNEYVLFYQHRRNLGRFADHANVTERVLWAPETATWDQIVVPLACWRHAVDVLFHPKFTAPLLTRSRVVMTVHGAEWFFPDQARFYNWLTVWYLKTFMPLYLRKCSAVISVSQLTTAEFYQAFPQLPPDKVRTVYFAPARHFRRVGDPAELERVRAQYGLPNRFILTLTKRRGDGRKNLQNLLQAYSRYHERTPNPIPLVVGGKDCHLFRPEYSIPTSGYGADVMFPGWLDQRDLPAIYSMADMYLYPSNLEAFPIPLTEAMACGAPIVTSDANGLREIAGDAAMLVDPEDPDAIAAAMARVLNDASLQQTLRERGLARSALFQWETCARETLAILEAVGPPRTVRAPTHNGAAVAEDDARMMLGRLEPEGRR
jgi:glycosyltransferase involved in cell wall biosynthesis